MTTPFHRAVLNGNLVEVKACLSEQKFNPNLRDPYQQTPLHVACLEGNVAIVKLLLSYGGSASVLDRNGWSPLHCAASKGNLDVCLDLLKLDDVDATALNKDGTSVLHYLVRANIETNEVMLKKYLVVLTRLLARGADVDSQTKHGESALHQAAFRGTLSVVRFLLNAGANVNLLNKKNETPLHYAVRAEQFDIVQLLLKRGADASIRSDEGTPTEIAMNPRILALLSASDVSTAQRPTSTRKLVVTVVRSSIKLEGSILAESGGTIDPYVVVVFNKQKKQTEVLTHTMTPRWNQSFEFDMEEFNSPLIISVCDRLKSGHSDVLGQLTIALSDMNLTTDGVRKAAFAWKKRKGNSKILGKIRLALGYVVAEPPQQQQEQQQQPERTRRPFGSRSRSGSGGGSGDSSGSGSGGSIGGGGNGHSDGAKESADDASLNMGEVEGALPSVAPARSVVASTGGKKFGRKPSAVAALQRRQKKKESQNQLLKASQSQSPNANSQRQVERASPGNNRTGAGVVGNEGGRGMGLLSGRRDNMFSWQIDSNELTFVSRLGEGTSAKVFKGLYRGQDVAIKVLKDSIDKQQQGDFQKEFDIMTAMRSPNVVYFYGACFDPSLCMVLEFCSQGSLHEVLNRKGEDIGWGMVLKATTDIVKAINCLHNWKPPIVHRDLKSLNILVDDHFTCKVADFGLSRFTTGVKNMSTLGKLRGTYAYAAPEVYFGQPYTALSDIFSVGIMLWELCVRCVTGKYYQPYSEFKKLVYDFQIIIQTAKNELRPTIPDEVPEAFKTLIRTCWDAKPTNRPTASVLLDSLQDVRADYEANKSEWDSAVGCSSTFKSLDDDDDDDDDE